MKDSKKDMTGISRQFETELIKLTAEVNEQIVQIAKDFGEVQKKAKG